MGWYSLATAAGLGLITGCASHPAQGSSEATSGDVINTRMNASFSSDSAGVQDVEKQPQFDSNVPVQLTLDQLPPAAQATVRREAGKKRVVKILRETQNGNAYYRVKLTRDGHLFHGLLVVTPDGTLLREEHMPAPTVVTPQSH